MVAARATSVLKMKKYLILLLMVAASWQFYKQPGQVSLGPGVKAKEVPQQQSFDSSITYSDDDYIIHGIAKFRIKAKVLSKKNYHFGREADLSPTDLALGWGNMSDESVLEKIKISQSVRYYRWSVKTFPIPRREIETHSANMHLIPANDSVKSVIKRVRQGDIIEISGSLVNVKSTSDDWSWTSSQTRDDTGRGACELVWVDSASIGSRKTNLTLN